MWKARRCSLARTAEEDGNDEPDADETALAADLVAEVVATYEEEHSEEPPSETAVFIPLTETATFPPLAKALVEGNRCSLDDMKEVLDEHDRTNESIARILTAQGLVTEDDFMWGMAQEMGLEFVDLNIWA